MSEDRDLQPMRSLEYFRSRDYWNPRLIIIRAIVAGERDLVQLTRNRFGHYTPARKIRLPLIVQMSHLEKAHLDVGEFLAQLGLQ